jgi:hypothetical protein
MQASFLDLDQQAACTKAMTADVASFKMARRRSVETQRSAQQLVRRVSERMLHVVIEQKNAVPLFQKLSF